MKSFIFGLIFSIVLVVNPFQVTAASTPSGIPLEELEAFVDQFASEHIGQKTVGASVVVLKDGDIVLSKGYGQGDVANNVRSMLRHRCLNGARSPSCSYMLQ